MTWKCLADYNRAMERALGSCYGCEPIPCDVVLILIAIVYFVGH